MTRALDVLRLLLGVVLFATALDYFLPFLPLLSSVVPDVVWSDPMAVRVLDVFERSGLLAVAKFIHVAGGALLIVNRLVPFALAATMPVNICGAFISVVLEGDPLLALLALALVALHAFLMLCYLPYYARMLRQDELADGERAEPGANYNSLFVNPLSGARPAAYLGGGAVLAAALYAYWQVIPFANGTMGLYTLVFPAAIFAIGLVRALMRRRSGPDRTGSDRTGSDGAGSQ